jgi:hypothetical protein
MLDTNDAGEQMRFGNLIPDGAFLKVQLNFKRGGENLPNMDAADNGLFSTSKSSDAIGIQAELTVLEPADYAHRKIFEWWTVSGGSLDDKGISKGWNITKARLRAVLESATNTNPKDESPQAKANRQISAFSVLENCPFYAKVTVEIGNDREGGGKYPDKNKLDYVVTPADPEYAPLRAGQKVDPKPRNAPHAPAAAKGAAPAWSGGAQPAAPAKPAWQAGNATAGAGGATAPPAQQPATPGSQTAPAQPGRPAWATG